MPVVAVTGGIASGKTTFARQLHRILHGHLFDADACAHQLLAEDSEVREQLRVRFGKGVILTDGSVNRSRLREIVFRDQESKRVLENILHPRIREKWIARATAAQNDDTHWLIIDIPLLYETGGDQIVEKVIVVACSEATQFQRMQEKRGLSREMSERMIHSQQPLTDKIRQATHVVWTEASENLLEAQARLLAAYLNYG